jgi:hypothetical protein
MAMERKHYVLTYMNRDQDHLAEVYAEYQGEHEDFLVKVGYWAGSCLIVPNWFDTKEQAQEYIDHVNDRTLRNYYMVQERRYPDGDLRVSSAKKIFALENDFYPQPDKGYTQEKAGEPMIEVWTMYFYDREAADQYVENVNTIAGQARELMEK